MADTATAGSSVTITAVIEPVRIIVVNDRGIITEVMSNGPSRVRPKVYLDRPNGKQIELSRHINDQYSSIMHRVDQRATGTIYKRKDPESLTGLPASVIISVLIAKVPSIL